MMHCPTCFPVPLTAFYRLFVIASASLFTSGLLTSCATTTPALEGHAYEYQQLHRYVRLEPIEPGSMNNEHPAKISPQSLQAWFSELKATGNVRLGGEISAFTDDELNEVVGHISAALSRARPDQDIAFQSKGSRGIFGKHTAPSFTSGRVFVRNGQLNLILGVLHTSPDPYGSEFDDALYQAGSRSGRIETGWQLSHQGTGQLVDGRGDWVSFAMTKAEAVKIPQQPTVSASPEPVDSAQESMVDQRSQEIGSKLRVLDELKDKKLITEEEYREQRKAILQGI